MQFTREQLQRFASWETVEPAFTPPRESGVLLEELSAAGLCCDVFEDAGMSNYFGIWIGFEPPATTSDGRIRMTLEGATLYLSALGPYAAFGRSTRWPLNNDQLGPIRITSFPHLDLESVISPYTSDLTRLLSEIVRVVGQSPYQLLDVETLGAPLPADVRPYEYCMCPEPWDRVFHVMFANTD